MSRTTRISGWGNYPRQEAQLLTPSSIDGVGDALKGDGRLIARGRGRSYGDSANACRVLATSYFDRFLSFDETAGILTAEAGITLRQILEVIVPKGWFLPVTPGTSYVSLGGAIASDVHGKNHQIAGTFGQHVRSMTVMLGDGEVVATSEAENTDLFYATCGGMGLTGVITSATLKLLRIPSSYIDQRTIKADCIEALYEAFEANSSSTYRVAWIDCFAKGKNLGRGVLRCGEHVEEGGLNFRLKTPVYCPVYAPPAILNSATMRVFNKAYWYIAKDNTRQLVPMMSYFYPLDTIESWNKLYGKPGFLQFQCVLPQEDALTAIRKLLAEVTSSQQASFLAVLKKFGKANHNVLSFPIEGYTLSVDFKLTDSTLYTVKRLNSMVASMGGRVYLTKDAVMDEVTFKSTYLNWESFEHIRHKYGAIGCFSSAQSERLGLG